MDSNERVPFFSIPNNMILTRILSSIAYNIHLDFGLQNSVFFTVKTPITFLFPAPCYSLLILPYDYATTSPEIWKKRELILGLFSAFLSEVLREKVYPFPPTNRIRDRDLD
jgi:hypothetical protein